MPEEILVRRPCSAASSTASRRRCSATTCGTIDVHRPRRRHVPRRLLDRRRPRDDGADHRRRRRQARSTSCAAARCMEGEPLMGRKILFVTTDQQRYDTLGCNGGTLARTPVVDALAAARHPLRAGAPAVGRVHAVALDDPHRPAPEHPRRVDERRAAAGRRAVGRRRCCTTPATARRSIGKPHFEPFLDPFARFAENRFARDGDAAGGTHRGFEHLEFGDPRRRSGRCTTPAGWRPSTPRRSGCSTPCSTATLRGQRRRRRRHRRAAGARQRRSRGSGTTPTGWPTARSPGSTRSTPTTTGSAG